MAGGRTLRIHALACCVASWQDGNDERHVPLGIGPLELVIVLLILIVIFGPKRLPGLGRSLGSGMREFKESITGSGKSDDEDDEDKRELRSAEREDEIRREPARTEPARTEPARREPEAVAVEAEPAASEKGASGHST